MVKRSQTHTGLGAKSRLRAPRLFLVPLFVVMADAAPAGPLEDGLAAEDRKDYATALQLLKSLSDSGDPRAETGLAYMYEFGWGVPQDLVESVRLFRKAADQGDGEAQEALGTAYKVGQGVPPNDFAAAKWYREAAKSYRKAAEHGDAKAEINLAWLCEDGWGVPKDLAESAKWFRKAAEQGNAEAQIILGLLYLEARGVPEDPAEAVKWFRRAADQGAIPAQRYLGYLYSHTESGLPFGQSPTWQGVDLDYVLAHMWFNLAAAQGDDEALHKRGEVEIKMTPQQIAQAERLATEWRTHKSKD